jgi:hypothetical protein
MRKSLGASAEINPLPETTREQESLFQHRRKPKSLIFKVFEGKD